MEHEENKKQPGFWEKNRMLFKGLIIGFFILLMMIPVLMLSDLISEREQRQNQVINEVSSKWATEQTISGPIIILPYWDKADSAKVYTRHNAYILPEQLNINGKLLPEVRHRSLYNVMLYRSDLQISGSFDFSYLEKLGIPAQNIIWDGCHVALGLNDARGLEEDVVLRWDTGSAVLESGVPDNTILSTGLSAKIAPDTSKKMPFSINLKLKGSTYLYFTPLGKSTQVSLSSPWKNPAFDGYYLPTEQAKITDNGFMASWKILQVSRFYPQAWKDPATYNIAQSSFGVKLLQPTDGYAKTHRSVKYAMLIIALTFTIFFFVEIFQKKQVHPLQYILVGIALCVFYSLLLSMSEYIAFNSAYLVAATATVLLISLYALGIFKKLQIAAGFAAALGALYTYIFVLIQLQDYALLFGSIGLFVILAIIMYYSRKINWYGTSTQS